MATCPVGHPLTLRDDSETAWACGGVTNSGLCVRGLNDPGRHPHPHHECAACKYTVCDRCAILVRVKNCIVPRGLGLAGIRGLMAATVPEAMGVTRTCTAGHPLTLDVKAIPGDWLCDGSAEAGGCCGVGEADLERWRCGTCNFDLCNHCLARRLRRGHRGLDAVLPSAYLMGDEGHAEGDVGLARNDGGNAAIEEIERCDDADTTSHASHADGADAEDDDAAEAEFLLALADDDDGGGTASPSPRSASPSRSSTTVSPPPPLTPPPPYHVAVGLRQRPAADAPVAVHPLHRGSPVPFPSASQFDSMITAKAEVEDDLLTTMTGTTLPSVSQTEGATDTPGGSDDDDDEAAFLAGLEAEEVVSHDTDSSVEEDAYGSDIAGAPRRTGGCEVVYEPHPPVAQSVSWYNGLSAVGDPTRTGLEEHTTDVPSDSPRLQIITDSIQAVTQLCEVYAGDSAAVAV